MNAARNFFARNLAAAMLAGEWSHSSIVERLERAWGRKHRWLSGLATRTVRQHPTLPGLEPLQAMILADAQFRRQLTHLYRAKGKAQQIEVFTSNNPHAITTEPLPKLETHDQLAAFLGLTPGQLTVYADIKNWSRFHRFDQRRHNYRYRWVAKRGTPSRRNFFGRITDALGLTRLAGPGHRLLEIPKPRLKAAQRKILDEILHRVVPHECAHGFTPGRSIKSNALPHCQRDVILRFDLVDFFPSVTASRVKGIFLTLGYPPTIARLLTGLCTIATPEAVWKTHPGPWTTADISAQEQLRRWHLPQGTPTSPMLANLSAFRLDCRLRGLAKSLRAYYTRYADDFTLSIDRGLLRKADKLRQLVTTIAAEEGFIVNVRKHRVLKRGQRQRVTGVVVNEHPNMSRRDFDRLKAILTNCIRHGPTTQNRDGVANFREHLQGRVAHVMMLNEKRGAKLQKLFERIDWGERS